MFQGKSFLKEIDFSKEELICLIDLAIHLKRLKKENIQHKYLMDKNIALIFEKTSTRTRAAFTTAAVDLGAHPEFLGPNDIQLGKKESISDTAKVLGRMFDGIEFRGYKQADVETLARDSGVPVWNGLTDEWHPTQMLADFMTIKEHFGRLKKLTLVYVGDGRNNVANSLLVTATILGMDVTIVSPEALQPTWEIQQLARKNALRSGSKISIRTDINAVANADIIYTDVWISMGEEDQTAERINLLKPYQINKKLTDKILNREFIFMHCLPSFHDMKTKVMQQIKWDYNLEELEVTDEIFQSENSIVFEQAENRMHTIKAVMAATLGHLFFPSSLSN